MGRDAIQHSTVGGGGVMEHNDNCCFAGCFCGSDCPHMETKGSHTHNSVPIAKCGRYRRYLEYASYRGFLRCNDCLRSEGTDGL